MCGCGVTFLPAHACAPPSLGCCHQTVIGVTQHILLGLEITSEGFGSLKEGRTAAAPGPSGDASLSPLTSKPNILQQIPYK